jgi:hypothetical protein
MSSIEEQLPIDLESLKDKTVIFCLPGNSFSNNFLLSWTELIIKCKEYGIRVYYTNKYTSNVYYVRNMCLGGNVLKGKNQKPYQGQLKYDYIMWIDSDIYFKPEQFFYMLSEAEQKNIKVLSGAYIMHNNHQYPIVKNMDFDYFKEHGTFEFLTRDKIDDLPDFSEVDYTGFGFILIKYNIFEQLKYPWFSSINIKIDEEIQDFCSEDVSFCLKMKKKNIPIILASKVRVKHEKMVCL